MTMQVTVTRDGTTTDITEAVTRLYDLMVNTMDWGSGFLDHEDVAHIRAVQVACGLPPEEYDKDECRTCGHYRDEHSRRRGGPHPCRHAERRKRLPDGTYTGEAGCPCQQFIAPWAKAILGKPVDGT